MPVYILDMLELPAEIKSAFEKGEFSIRQTSGSFNGIWSDMGTEKTTIKDLKGSGGIVGITNQKSALVRWTLTRYLLSQVSALFFTFVDSRQQRILYFSGSMHACRNIHETRRVGLYIKGVSHGFVQKNIPEMQIW
jgi:hypothetical protein